MAKTICQIYDFFDEIRSGRKLTQSKWEEVIDVVLAIIDFLKDEISKVQEGLFPQASIEELYQRSSNLLKEDIEENNLFLNSVENNSDNKNFFQNMLDESNDDFENEEFDNSSIQFF